MRKHHFDSTNCHSLGLYLGLLQPTINAIKDKNGKDPEKCLEEILEKWLCRADNVEKIGVPRWFVLIAQIRLINRAAAEAMDDESK